MVTESSEAPPFRVKVNSIVQLTTLIQVIIFHQTFPFLTAHIHTYHPPLTITGIGFEKREGQLLDVKRTSYEKQTLKLAGKALQDLYVCSDSILEDRWCPVPLHFRPLNRADHLKNSFVYQAIRNQNSPAFIVLFCV